MTKGWWQETWKVFDEEVNGTSNWDGVEWPWIVAKVRTAKPFSHARAKQVHDRLERECGRRDISWREQKELIQAWINRAKEPK